MSLRRSQKGVVLLAALIIVAISTVIAVAISFDTGLSMRRTQGAEAQEQALLITGGAEALAAKILIEQLNIQGLSIHNAQQWHQPIGPLEIFEGASLESNLEDLQGRFNLNSLVNSSGVIEPYAVEVFERLLVNLGLESKWASAMADWIDTDLVETLPYGAEDSAYLGLNPPYRTANQLISSTSELMSLKDFGLERYVRIAPYVSALPSKTPINLCAASAPLLDALNGERQWTQASEALERNRERRCFPRPEEFKSTFLDSAMFTSLSNTLGFKDRSEYFQLRSFITVGTVQFSLYSLLYYNAQNKRIQVLARQFAE